MFVWLALSTRRAPRPEEIDDTLLEAEQQALDLPDREAMSIIKPSLFPLDLGGPLGPMNLPASSTGAQAITDTAPAPDTSPLDELA